MRTPFAALLLLAACSGAGAESASDAPSSTQPGAPAVQAEASAQPGALSDPATPVRARVGQDFAIILESNGTTGYEWMLAESVAPSMLKLVESRYVAPGGGPLVPGQGGHEVWTFRPLAAGQAAIRMRYSRSWDRQAADDTATFRVLIER